MQKPIIRVDNLNKTFKQYHKAPGLWGSVKSVFSREYESIEAVKDVSFEIQDGEFVGFIGSNGAGKTTTLKSLSGLLYPTNGFVEVMGHQPWQREREFLRQISLVMGQKNQLWWDLPASDSFLLNKEIYEIPTNVYNKTLDFLVEMLEIGDILDVQVRKLSLGQRMKCELASALLHSPKVLFLDEPTIGLDVVMQKKLRTFFKSYNEQYGTTIMLTSHYMEDVKELCKRIIIIDAGAIVYDGSLKELVSKYAIQKKISLVFSKKIAKRDLLGFGELEEFDGISAVISVDRVDVPNVSAAMLKKFPIEDLDIKEFGLDEVVRLIFTKD